MSKFKVGYKTKESKTEFGKLIYARRLELGLSQVVVASRMGVVPTTLGQWEISKHPYISAEKIPDLAKALEIEVSAIEAVIPDKASRVNRMGPVLRKPLTEFGKFIQDRRVALGITQKKLSELTGFTVNTLLRYESGLDHSFPKPVRLQVVAEKLAVALQVEPEQILAVIPKEVEETWEPRYELGCFIRNRRHELDLTIAGLAGKMNRSVGEVRNVEKQGESLKFDSIPAWAEGLEVGEEELRNKFVRKAPHEKPTRSELGGFIRTQRQAIGLTIEELAEKLGVSRQLISQMEIGRYNASNNGQAEKLAETLRVDVAELKKRAPNRNFKKKKEGASALGNFVIKRRTELQISCAELARRTGISMGALHFLEKGRTANPHQKLLEKLSKVIGEIPIEALPAPKVQDSDDNTPEWAPLAVLRLEEVVAEDLLAVKELGRIKRTNDALAKGLRVFRKLLEKQKGGYRLLLVKDNETVELDLML